MEATQDDVLLFNMRLLCQDVHRSQISLSVRAGYGFWHQAKRVSNLQCMPTHASAAWNYIRFPSWLCTLFLEPT